MTKDVCVDTDTSTRYQRRRLPHYEVDGFAYFVTYKTVAGLYLSQSAKDIVLDSVRFHSGKIYMIDVCVVMDTHVHSVFRPLEMAAQDELNTSRPFYSLSGICHSIKSYSAHKVNKTMGRTGSVWQGERYDRAVRGEADLRETVAYVMWNPVKAGLVDRPEDYRWLYVAE